MTQIQLHTLDLPSFVNQIHRQTIGFDRMFDELNRTFANSRTDNYPPHNVVKLDDTHYVIEVAVAGFAENEIDVELKDNVLTVKGEQTKKENEIEYLHKGISARNFVRTFPLAEHIEVRGATVNNGILSVALEMVVPEENKPKKIAITFKK
jgi:molecular chaperone IbpA